MENFKPNDTHTQLLALIYSDFQKGDYTAMLAKCSDAMTFQIAGKSKLAGKFTSANFISGFVTQLKEISGGSYSFELHDLFASDRHGIALLTEKIMRDGKAVEYRAVHVWRIEGGKPVAWYSYPRDLYAFDAIWG